jgi:hypothetical protein
LPIRRGKGLTMRFMAMNKDNVANVFLITGLCLLAVSMLHIAGCATPESDKFRNEIQNMSDADLLYYYRGLNERTKDIEHDMQGKEYRYDYDPKHNVYSTPFSVGGEGYRLTEEMRMIKEELKRRNIQP